MVDLVQEYEAVEPWEKFMTKIGLIRHGVTEWNDLGKAQGITDVPLNDEGISQAIKLGQRLSDDENWDMIIKVIYPEHLKLQKLLAVELIYP